jgi:rubrerythrin
LRLAYSAERAAAYAYQGHASSVKSVQEKASLKVIEDDEWRHREAVLDLMTKYSVEPSKFLEFKYAFIGRVISFSCHLIGWFLPNYFAGRLESQNVQEYYNMRDLFHSAGITEHDQLLEELGRKEAEHEFYFMKCVEKHWLMPLFSFVFRWGPTRTLNIDLLNEFNPPSDVE